MPSPPGAVPGQPRQLLRPSPPQKRAQRGVGGRTGQPQRPTQTLCDEHWAPACKSCKRHKGVRHCCSHHHEGHPRVLGGGGQRCPPVQGGWGGGLQQQLALCPSRAGASTGSLVRGEGGVQQGREQQCCRAEARRSRSAATGGPQRRAHNPRRTSLRRAATHRGARGGIGRATGRL